MVGVLEQSNLLSMLAVKTFFVMKFLVFIQSELLLVSDDNDVQPCLNPDKQPTAQRIYMNLKSVVFL